MADIQKEARRERELLSQARMADYTATSFTKSNLVPSVYPNLGGVQDPEVAKQQFPPNKPGSSSQAPPPPEPSEESDQQADEEGEEEEQLYPDDVSLYYTTGSPYHASGSSEDEEGSVSRMIHHWARRRFGG